MRDFTLFNPTTLPPLELSPEETAHIAGNMMMLFAFSRSATTFSMLAGLAFLLQAQIGLTTQLRPIDPLLMDFNILPLSYTH